MGGGSKSTTTTTVTQTPEERAFTQKQIELATQQLRLVEEQHGWQSELYQLTKPLLQKYGLMVDQEFADYNTPEAAALRDKYRTLEGAQLDSQIRNLPIQEELLQRQLDEIRRGGRATDEQKALIGEIANRALEAGESDIGNFLQRGLGQIREELAPARGLRPTDSPMIDAGGELAMEALRQQGLLTSNIRGAQANAELNFPLNASQVYGQANQWQQQFNQGMNQFLAGMRQNAVQNRAQLMGQMFTAPMAAGEQGIGLINASRPTPVSFPRNTTETTKQSGGGSILGGIGGFLSGVGQVAGIFSSEKAKTNIKPLLADGQHLLSPGALKTNVEPVGGPYRTLGGMPITRGSGPAQGGISEMYPTHNMALDAALGNNPAGFDPWIAAGNRMSPDSVSMPMIEGPPKTDEEALKRISQLPVAQWNYKPEVGMGTQTHIGPMAEQFNTKVMGKGPEPLISTVDAIGSLTSAVKALEARTRPGIAPGMGGGFWGGTASVRSPQASRYARIPGNLTRGFRRRAA